MLFIRGTLLFCVLLTQPFSGSLKRLSPSLFWCCLEFCVFVRQELWAILTGRTFLRQCPELDEVSFNNLVFRTAPKRRQPRQQCLLETFLFQYYLKHLETTVGYQMAGVFSPWWIHSPQESGQRFQVHSVAVQESAAQDQDANEPAATGSTGPARACQR